MSENLRQLNKAEMAGLNMAQRRLFAARDELAAAELQVREMFVAVGLDPDATYNITPDGIVTPATPSVEEAVEA